MSDEAVKAKTGKTWKQWFEILKRAGASKMSHQEIVGLLTAKHNVGPWWQQMITVSYERHADTALVKVAFETCCLSAAVSLEGSVSAELLQFRSVPFTKLFQTKGAATTGCERKVCISAKPRPTNPCG